MKVRFVKVMDHIEVYINDQFQFSADTMSEALRELNDGKESC